MEWCLDTRVPGAPQIAEDEICAHLLRHSIDSGTVELARPALQEALGGRPETGPLLWVTLDWEDAQPLLAIHRLPDGPMPGAPVAPGVTRCHDPTTVPVWSGVGSTPDRLRLGVSRAPEGDLDPHPRTGGGAISGAPLSLAGAITDEIAAGRTLEEAAARAGATVAGEMAATFRGTRPGPKAIAEMFMEAERRLGGAFHLVTADDDRAVLGNRKCPFGPSARPAMCRFTSALAGGLGARLAGGAEVTLDERLALGDAQCRLILDLGEPTGRLTSHRYSWPPAGFPAAEADERPAPTRGFRVTLSLQLPRDRLSVPVTRHLIRAAMEEVGVIPQNIDETELALSEACGNVIDHSGPGDAYEVTITLSPSACHIRVVDVGHGFDHQALTPDMADLDAEHGRGVALMHALVDQVRFESRPERGTVVHLVKRLRFDDQVPARKLMLESLDDPPS